MSDHRRRFKGQPDLLEESLFLAQTPIRPHSSAWMFAEQELQAALA